jgi:hypothetical protein
VGIVLFVIADVLVLVAAASVVARLHLVGLLDRVVALGTLAVTQIELSLLISGAGFDSLDRPAVLLLNVISMASALAYGGRDLRASLAHLPRPHPGRLLRGSPWATVLVGLATAELIWRVFLAAVLPPFAYDALNYHLTTTAEWIQRGQLVTPSLNSCCAHYPLNAELSFVWPALLLGDDTLVQAVQIGFAVLGALAVAGVGRIAGLSRKGAAAAGAMFFLTPVILAQSNTNYNDVAFTAMFLCGLYFVLRYITSPPRTAYLGLGGLAAGFALGSKGTGFLYAGVLLLVVAGGVLFLIHRRSTRPALALAAVATFTAGLIVTGGFWYGRNLVSHGNPVYPFEVKLAGVQIFSGPSRLNAILSNPVQYHGESNWYRVLHSWARDAIRTPAGGATYDYQEVVGGFGIAWPWLMLPALVAFTAFAVRRRHDLLFALLLPVAVIFLLQPYQWWSRFTLILPAMGAVALVHLVERSRRRARIGLQLASAVLVLFGAELATRRIAPASRAPEISALRVVQVAFGPARDRTLGRLFFPEYAWLDRIPSHATIDVELGKEPRFVYPDFGPKFSRPVYALRARTARAFEEQVSLDGAAYVFVGHGSPFDRMASDDRALTPIYESHRVSVYRVLPFAATATATKQDG